MKILAIESSCDETSAAVVGKKNNKIIVLSNVTATSLAIHSKTGGIIPENAAREQVKYIIPVITQALNESNGNTSQDWKSAREILQNDIDAIAVTYGPGLIGSLLVGVETARTLSFMFDKPLIPVNHLIAHLFANFIDSKSRQTKSTITFPFIGLIVSGGHTDLLYFESESKFKWLGGTRDDAAGEALDKIGRLLGLSYPAGPEIEKRAKLASSTLLRFKSPLSGNETFDFSFSGLKTEVLRFTQKTTLNETVINEVCFAVQKAVIDVLVKKTLKAAEKYSCNTILLGGGVSANQTLKKELNRRVKSENRSIQIFSPEKMYCTDNGAMVGAYTLLNPKQKSWKDVNANPELYFL